MRRAEQVVEALKRQWLAIVAIADNGYSEEQVMSRAQCAALPGGGGCAVDFTMGVSSRCGFASDWCIGAGTIGGGVSTSLTEAPRTTGSYYIDAYRTSEAAAAAAGALGVLLQAYRDADGRLTVGTSTLLKRLKATASRDVFDPAARHDPDGRNLLLREEDSIATLVSFAGATDGELRELSCVTRGYRSR